MTDNPWLIQAVIMSERCDRAFVSLDAGNRVVVIMEGCPPRVCTGTVIGENLFMRQPGTAGPMLFAQMRAEHVEQWLALRPDQVARVMRRVRNTIANFHPEGGHA